MEEHVGPIKVRLFLVPICESEGGWKYPSKRKLLCSVVVRCCDRGLIVTGHGVLRWVMRRSPRGSGGINAATPV